MKEKPKMYFLLLFFFKIGFQQTTQSEMKNKTTHLKFYFSLRHIINQYF